MEQCHHHKDNRVAAKTTSIRVIHVPTIHEHFDDENQWPDQWFSSQELTEKSIASDAIVKSRLECYVDLSPSELAHSLQLDNGNSGIPYVLRVFEILRIIKNTRILNGYKNVQIEWCCDDDHQIDVTKFKTQSTTLRAIKIYFCFDVW